MTKKNPLALSALLMESGVIDYDSRRKLQELIVHLVRCATFYGMCRARGEPWAHFAVFDPEDWGIETEVAGEDWARRLDELDWDKVLPIPEEGGEED